MRVRFGVPLLAGALASVGLALSSGAAIAQVYEVVHAFSARSGWPIAGLAQGADARLYGTISFGGLHGLGSVYVLTPDGNGGYAYSELYSATPADGVDHLDTTLLAATDGRFYGVATHVPSNGGIFRVDALGNFQLLHAFVGSSEGAQPSGLIEVDGAFYGVARNQGGGLNIGTLFRMDSDGIVTVLHRFAEPEGGRPAGPLLAATDGFLYGTTSDAASNFLGAVYKSDLSGNLTVVHAFAEGEGLFAGTLVEGDGGILFGTMAAGGSTGNGTVFRIDASGALTTLHSFSGGADGGSPGSALTPATDGYFYGTTYYGGPEGLGTVFRIDAAGNLETLRGLAAADGTRPVGTMIEVGGRRIGTSSRDGAGGVGTAFAIDGDGNFEVLHAFRGAPEGTSPGGGLVEADDGFLYGAAGVNGDRGYGTIYRLPFGGGLSVVHPLDGFVDGGGPGSDLMQGSDGALYGTALGGGAGSFGTVFRCETTGVFTTLHSFTEADGRNPHEGLAQASDGRYYGATYGGGASDLGTLFRVDALGDFETLHEFDGSDGGYPLGGLLASSDGNLYGTTAGAPLDGGTLFRLGTSGGFETLHDFVASGGPEGFGPVGTLIEPLEGNVYGITRQGGGGRGAVYRFDFDGNLSVVTGLPQAGGAPSGGLVADEHGNLYGVRQADPGWTNGTIFRVDPSGQYSAIHVFNVGDGAGPRSRLVRASDGKLYGTTEFGGALRGGVVFRIDPTAVISISSASPNSGPSGGGTLMTILGSAFQPGARVFFDLYPAAEVTVASSSQLLVITPELPASAAYEVLVINADGLQAKLPWAWVADPLDVPPSSLYYDAIGRMLANGVAAGCGDGAYCPNAVVTRAQLAVLLLKAKLGPLYLPPPATGRWFLDVPIDAFAASWIEDLASRGISSGCGGANFCPSAAVTRATLAPLLLKTLLGTDYVPPPATGLVFDDVSADTFAAAWIEDLAARGIAAGCSAVPALYCPAAAVSRGQAAAFLVDTFALP